MVSVASKRGGGGGKDLTSADHHRMLEEFDHERKVRKRRARLLTAAEEAFTHIRRVREGSNSGGTYQTISKREKNFFFKKSARFDSVKS